MKKIYLAFISLFLLVAQINAQQKVVYGTVYAFKNLPLNNIKVAAAKEKTVVQTDSLGKFKIICQATDKLEFTGEGFRTLTRKLEKTEKTIKVKMIFKGGKKNIALAVDGDHVSKEKLENEIKLHSDQNVEYYNYPDIFTAISRIYVGNDDIIVRNNSVFVRKDNTQFSAYPAIFILNGKLALDIKDIMPRDIESIEIIADGSKLYGPGAANGAVLITTNQK